MSLNSDLFTYLKNTSGVTAKFGTGDNMRIYPDKTSTLTTVFPFATYQRVSSDHEHHLSAASGLVSALYRFDVFDNDSVSRGAAAESLREAMDGYKEGTMTAVDVRWIELQNERDEYIGPTASDEVGVFSTTMDFLIWYRESIPTF